MRLIVIRDARDDGTGAKASFLRYALSTAPLADVVAAGLDHLWCCRRNDDPAGWTGRTGAAESRWAIPRNWQGDLATDPGPATFYADSLDSGSLGPMGRTHPWSIISNGRYATQINFPLLGRILADTKADVVAVTAAPDLLACREWVRLTRDNELVGYRRLYADSTAPTPVPADWPHHLLVRREAVDRVCGAGLLSRFDSLVAECRAQGLNVQAVGVAGSAVDLESEDGILTLCRMVLNHSPGSSLSRRLLSGWRTPHGGGDSEVSPQARLIGPVLLGKGVTVEAHAVVAGPSVLCNHSTVRRDAIVDSSIVGADASVEPNQVIRDGIIAATKPSRPPGRATAGWAGGSRPEHLCSRQESIFRLWPRLSYARCIKRIADLAAAVVVLVLFAPVIPFLALAIKINSPGPVFFRDKRQGLHGKLFDCVKFRTMRVGSDKMQEKLRFVSEVDGPQFKMADDPRITTVGWFLRETYLDEIPQFLNVLRGQMSVVGPRPSPESENTLCPSWRDARLSVRPGITGLWQVCRTRERGKDFQEWIHYDTQYVREFSPRLDLWICWRTFRRMVENFVSQF